MNPDEPKMVTVRIDYLVSLDIAVEADSDGFVNPMNANLQREIRQGRSVLDHLLCRTSFDDVRFNQWDQLENDNE